MLLETYRCAAALLKIDIEELKETLKNNAEAVFTRPPLQKPQTARNPAG
jgi:hypothetical protein